MNHESRNVGIDIVKAISISLVLMWHLRPITADTMRADGYTGICWIAAIEFFYYYISLLAVPSFICVSLYLFMKKSFLAGNYWKRRLLRLVQVFLFWTGIQFIFYLLAGGALPLPLNTIPHGGPTLPNGSSSVFYFLYVLIQCTLLASLFLKATDTVRQIVSVAVIILSCLHFACSCIYGISIDTMALENYCIYIPVAYSLAKNPNYLIRWRTIFICGYFLAIFYEKYVADGIVSAYGRLSILMGVLSLMTCCLPVKFPISRPTAYLAKFTLGIFAVHMYGAFIMGRMAEWMKSHQYIQFQLITAEKMFVFALTILFTFAAVYLLSKTKLRIYLS